MAKRDNGPQLPPAAREKPSVEPLHCPTCGAPVPLGDDDVVPCVACGARVPVPENLRELRRAEREDRADRADAEALYKKLGTPPSALLRAWVSVFVLGMGAVIAVMYALVAIGGIFLIFIVVGLELLMHALAGPIGINLVDRFGGFGAYALFALAALAFGALPMWLANYLQRSGELRLELQASLAARAPKRPGFPSTCRNCGAALEVPPNAYGVRCAYCRADNLVQLPAGWLGRARAKHDHIHGNIVEAVAQARALLRDRLETLKVGAAIGVVVVLVMGGVGYVAQHIDEDDIYHWGDSYGPPRKLVRWNGDPLPENQIGDTFLSTWIALHHGETIEVGVVGNCPHLSVWNTTSFPLIQDFDSVSFGIAADGTRVARYRAPYTGIFKLELKDADKLRWHLVHGTPTPLAKLTNCGEP